MISIPNISKSIAKKSVMKKKWPYLPSFYLLYSEFFFGGVSSRTFKFGVELNEQNCRAQLQSKKNICDFLLHQRSYYVLI